VDVGNEVRGRFFLGTTLWLKRNLHRQQYQTLPMHHPVAARDFTSQTHSLPTHRGNAGLFSCLKPTPSQYGNYRCIRSAASGWPLSRLSGPETPGENDLLFQIRSNTMIAEWASQEPFH
jgi:hypothetical protein